MSFLLDRDVVFEVLRKGGHAALKEWHRRTPATELYLPAVVLTEIRMGIRKLLDEQRQDDASMLSSPLRGRGPNFDRDLMIAARPARPLGPEELTARTGETARIITLALLDAEAAGVEPGESPRLVGA